MAPSLRTHLFGRKKDATADRKRQRRRGRLKFESLESRALMAADLLQLDQSQYATDHFLVQFREGTSKTAALGTAVAGAKVTKQISTRRLV